MISIDAFDLKILSALQDDGRLTNQELAELAGLSASQCSRRRMRLEEDKVIAGYHADLSSEALGFGVIAFIQVTLASGGEGSVHSTGSGGDSVRDGMSFRQVPVCGCGGVWSHTSNTCVFAFCMSVCW